jgi:hypothetical protein
LTKDGRFNYGRSFNVDTLPKLNGVPFTGNMDLPDVGIHLETLEGVKKMISDSWFKYGVAL